MYGVQLANTRGETKTEGSSAPVRVISFLREMLVLMGYVLDQHRVHRTTRNAVMFLEGCDGP